MSGHTFSLHIIVKTYRLRSIGDLSRLAIDSDLAREHLATWRYGPPKVEMTNEYDVDGAVVVVRVRQEGNPETMFTALRP